MADANDVSAGLLELAEREDVEAVICVVVLKGEADVEVFGFGDKVEQGEDVERYLDEAKQIIRKG